MLPDTLHCTGCGVCQSVCPVSAIKMKENAEGFCYPEIDASVCVHCGLCEKKCHLMSETMRHAPLSAYAVQYTRKGLKNSASGGAFMALADWMLARGGAVAGCAYDKALSPKHILIREAEKLPLLQGSKYVESDLGDVFSQVEAALRQGIPVLFTGTGCQIAALKKYLGPAPEELWTLEILCQGVPSRKLFREYIAYLGKCSPVTGFRFRSKEQYGWGDYHGQYTLQNGQTVPIDYDTDFYYQCFLRGDDYRESCYRCPYAGSSCGSDFLIGDCWGVTDLPEGFDKDAGVSLLLTYSERGQAMLTCSERSRALLGGSELGEELPDYSRQDLALPKTGKLPLIAAPADLDSAIAHQAKLRHAASRPKRRTFFYRLIRLTGLPGTVFLWRTKKRLAYIFQPG